MSREPRCGSGPLEAPTPDLVAVYEDVAPQLEDMIEAFDRHGGTYARQYLEHLVEPRCWRKGMTGMGTAQRPRELHPKIAAAIREVCEDAAIARRSLPVPTHRL